MQITRGDTKNYKFKRVNKTDDSVITTRPDTMYLTVKFDYNVDNVLFQKELDNGIKFDEETSYYYFTIKPSDTNELPYGKYVYDIEVTDHGKVTTIAIGEIDLTEEVTFYTNKENGGVNGEDVTIEDDEIEEIVTMEEYAPIIEGGGTGDYNDLSNKPSINDISLEGNKTLDDLGIQAKGDYALKEELPDTTGIKHDIENLTELVTENQDNIKNLQKADIASFNTSKPSDDGLVTINAVTKNNQNIQAFNIYNGLDAKYPYAAFGTQSAKELDERIKQLEEGGESSDNIPTYYFDGNTSSEENKKMFDEISSKISSGEKFAFFMINQSYPDMLVPCSHYSNNSSTLTFYYDRFGSTENGAYGVKYNQNIRYIVLYNKSKRVITMSNQYINSAEYSSGLISASNTNAWTPSTDYGLVHKKFVQDSIKQAITGALEGEY